MLIEGASGTDTRADPERRESAEAPSSRAGPGSWGVFLSELGKRTVVITDVTSTIGLATAILLSRSGHRVFGVVPEGTEVPEIAPFEPNAINLESDTSVRRGLAAVLGNAGRVDALVNNAGTSVVGALEETSIDQSNRLFQTNVFATLRCTYELLPHMRAQGTGRILNVSSILGIMPGPFMGMYAASQSALEGWSISLDQELRRQRIRVSTIRLAASSVGTSTLIQRADRPLETYRFDRERALLLLRRTLPRSLLPEIAAEVIEQALIDRSPKSFYVVGMRAKVLLAIRRFLPDALFDST